MKKVNDESAPLVAVGSMGMVESRRVPVVPASVFETLFAEFPSLASLSAHWLRAGGDRSEFC